MIADRIKYAREQNKLTQTELAHKLGVTRSSVNAWEMGTSLPSIQYIIEMADFFKVTTDYILDMDNKYMLDISRLDYDAQKIVIEQVRYFDEIHIIREFMIYYTDNMKDIEKFKDLGYKFESTRTFYDEILKKIHKGMKIEDY